MNIFLPSSTYHSTNTFSIEHITSFFENDLNETKKIIAEAKLKNEQCKSTNIDASIGLFFGVISPGAHLVKFNQDMLDELKTIKEKNITLVSKEEINDLIEINKAKYEKCKDIQKDFREKYPKDFNKAYKDIDQSAKDYLTNEYGLVLSEMQDRFTQDVATFHTGELIGCFRSGFTGQIVRLENNLKLITRIAEFKII